MLNTLFSFMSPYLMKKDAEYAHDLTLKMLKVAGLIMPYPHKNKKTISLMGLDFPNRLGIAAGFDKNAVAIDGLFALGFGYVEIGTITPKPQTGNLTPRLFRLPQDMGVINRMGFNNQGADTVSKRLKKYRDTGKNHIIGVNIGANKDSDNRIDDYRLCADCLLFYRQCQFPQYRRFTEFTK
jgi:dihydroorotate dehydrogenase